MKKITKNEFKVYLLGLLATLMTINSGVSLYKGYHKEVISENYSYYLTYNKFYQELSKYIYNSNIKLRQLNNYSFNICSYEWDMTINLFKNEVYINTCYSDGFVEESIIDLLSFNTNSIIDSMKHEIVYELEDYSIEQDESLVNEENIIASILASSDITYEEKELVIREAFKVSEEELLVCVAVIIREGNFKDCAAVTVNVLNRIFSYAWVNQAIKNMGLDKNYDEVTIYDIISSKGQYQVFDEKTYLYSYGDRESDAYKTIIDILYGCILGYEDIYHFHDYVEFVAPTLTPNGNYRPEQFVKNGNKHYRHQKETDRIPIDDSILREFMETYNNSLTLIK